MFYLKWSKKIHILYIIILYILLYLYYTIIFILYQISHYIILLYYNIIYIYILWGSNGSITLVYMGRPVLVVSPEVLPSPSSIWAGFLQSAGPRDFSNFFRFSGLKKKQVFGTQLKNLDLEVFEKKLGFSERKTPDILPIQCWKNSAADWLLACVRGVDLFFRSQDLCVRGCNIWHQPCTDILGPGISWDMVVKWPT